MDTIEQLDPFMPLYVQEKLDNPNANFMLRQFRAKDLMFVDRMIQLTRGKKSIVTTEDWENLKEVVKFFAETWPDEFESFKGVIDQIRHTRGKGGYSKSGDIRYVMALPPRLERIIVKLYPEQEFTKKFTNDLARKIPIFKVGGEKN